MREFCIKFTSENEKCDDKISIREVKMTDELTKMEAQKRLSNYM